MGFVTVTAPHVASAPPGGGAVNPPSVDDGAILEQPEVLSYGKDEEGERRRRKREEKQEDGHIKRRIWNGFQGSGVGNFGKVATLSADLWCSGALKP